MLEVGNYATGRQKQTRFLLSHEPWELKCLVWEYIPAGAVAPRILCESPAVFYLGVKTTRKMKLTYKYIYACNDGLWKVLDGGKGREKGCN